METPGHVLAMENMSILLRTISEIMYKIFFVCDDNVFSIDGDGEVVSRVRRGVLSQRVVR